MSSHRFDKLVDGDTHRLLQVIWVHLTLEVVSLKVIVAGVDAGGDTFVQEWLVTEGS